MALRSRHELAIYGWIEQERCGMTETGTCDRLVPGLGSERQSISGQAVE
jgi:hypothetical protein